MCADFSWCYPCDYFIVCFIMCGVGAADQNPDIIPAPVPFFSSPPSYPPHCVCLYTGIFPRVVNDALLGTSPVGQGTCK